MEICTVGLFLGLLVVAIATGTITVEKWQTLDTCVADQNWPPVPSFESRLLFFSCLTWAALLQCIPKCFPLCKRDPANVELDKARKKYEPSRSQIVGNPSELRPSDLREFLCNSTSPSTSSCDISPEPSVAASDRTPSDDQLSNVVLRKDRIDWDSCWILLFCLLYYLGYDATIKAWRFFGLDDAVRSLSITSNCDLDTDSIYNIYATLVRKWMSYAVVVYVSVRRSDDPWILWSYCRRASSRHSMWERFVFVLLLLQCMQSTAEVTLNGHATIKQIACSFLLCAIALGIMFTTLHVLQTDLHASKQYLRKRTLLPGRYTWCAFCVFVYWTCGFLFYLSTGSVFAPTNGEISEAVLYCCLHASVWIVFALVSYGGMGLTASSAF